ncbi:ABC-three component system middle component 8 [Type-D symbiont of Plautia stali]|uniref:ABC-three component system middle component 8 n=1 Tax=Type-D symbiont of Plautia stali TaxID=1560356 RepID=UPI001F295628|nr:ABC-three component system middle component 8 [Type-D symbiont of Plautia stali]
MMLRPTKHSHPDRTVINVSLLLLSRLKDRRVDEYEVLRKFAKKRVLGGDVLFLPALNFLYLMGLVEYRPKTDAVEYVGPNEAI